MPHAHRASSGSWRPSRLVSCCDRTVVASRGGARVSDQPNLSVMSDLSRRALIAGLLAGGVVGPHLLRTAAPASASDAATRTALADLEVSLIADHDQVLGMLPAGPSRRWVLTRRQLHVAHLGALADLGPVPRATTTPGPPVRPDAVTPSPTPTITDTTTATPSAPATPTPTSQDDLLRWLADRERRAHVRMRALSLASTDLATARIGALTAACERTHRIWDIAEQPSRDWTPAAGTTTDERVGAALDIALAHHHAAIWTLGRLGPRMTDRDSTRARTMHAEHTRWRDRTRAAIRATGRVPSGPATSYLLPTFSPTADQARQIVRDLERAGAAAWLGVFAVALQVGDAATRRAGFQALGDSAVRAALMGNVEAFPGFGDRVRTV